MRAADHKLRSGDAVASLLDYGRDVLDKERRALELLHDSLDGAFSEAVALLLSVKGRVVVTGMGKSGHVARKVAATLASTGTPALFVHPAEAAHGDLGMLTKDDALVAFSNSGGTIELQALLMHAEAHALPIIGVVGRATSPLARQASVQIVLPPVEEACPANLAPTSSTAMMMALGDALAIAAMKVRGISRAGFQALHPGGTIGKRFLRVAAVMHGEDRMPLVGPDDPMRSVMLTMTSASFGIAGIVGEDGALLGVITDGDLRRHVDDVMHACARDVMTHDPITISASSLVEDALALLNLHQITALFVTRDEAPSHPIGVIHIHDLLRLGIA